jgi:hypothetical protein
MRRKLPKYVNAYTDHTGKPRFYLRRRGQRNVALPGLPWSPQFMEAYEQALATPPSAIFNRVKQDSVEWLVHDYLASETFKALAAETQRTRKNVLLRFAREHGAKRYRMLRREHVVLMFNEKKPKRFAARNWLKTVHALMQYAVDTSKLAEDPTIGVKNVSGQTQGYMTWLEPQIEQYRARHPIGTMARLALELLLNIAARRSDAHVIGQQHVADGKIVWRPSKTLRSTGKLLRIKMLPSLQAALAAIPKEARADGVLTFIANDYGQPFASAAAFGNKFSDWCTAARLKPVVCDDGRTRTYRAHGLAQGGPALARTCRGNRPGVAGDLWT